MELTNGARARVLMPTATPHLHRHGAGGPADAVDRRGPAPFPGRAHVLRGRPGPRSRAHGDRRPTREIAEAPRSKPTAWRSATATASPPPTSPSTSSWRASRATRLHRAARPDLGMAEGAARRHAGRQRPGADAPTTAHKAIYEGDRRARPRPRRSRRCATISSSSPPTFWRQRGERAAQRMKIGVIGDDFTGSSDIANTLARAGARTVQYVGIPDAPPAAEHRRRRRRAEIPLDRRPTEAVVAIARRLPLACGQRRASRSSSNTARPSIPRRRAISARSPKRCSTSSARRSPWSARPFPPTAARVYQGHLFVGDRLLSEMRHGEATR